MAIKLIHVSDIHLGAGEALGPINPETGLNVRFEDFARAWHKVVDQAIDARVDVFLFSGDAYRNASPEPIYQMTFARQLKRLTDAGIKTILLVGNHDQIQKSTQSHSLSVFQSLEIKDVYVIDSPASFTVDTANGALQVIGIPYVTRHHLLCQERYAGLPANDIDRILINHVQTILEDYYERLDGRIPTVVTAHMSLDDAAAGIEQELLVGYNMTFPKDIFANDKVDYVALGHVHKHQILRDKEPAIVYAGSLERVDFGEENEDKGYVLVDLERQNTRYKFHSVNPRPFLTIDVDLTATADPEEALLCAIGKKNIEGSVLRIRYKITGKQLAQIDSGKIQSQAKNALSLKLIPEVKLDARESRIPELTEAIAAKPIEALEAYLNEVAPERKESLMKKAKLLMENLDQEDNR